MWYIFEHKRKEKKGQSDQVISDYLSKILEKVEKIEKKMENRIGFDKGSPLKKEDHQVLLFLFLGLYVQKGISTI